MQYALSTPFMPEERAIFLLELLLVDFPLFIQQIFFETSTTLDNWCLNYCRHFIVPRGCYLRCSPVIVSNMYRRFKIYWICILATSREILQAFVLIWRFAHTNWTTSWFPNSLKFDVDCFFLLYVHVASFSVQWNINNYDSFIFWSVEPQQWSIHPFTLIFFSLLFANCYTCFVHQFLWLIIPCANLKAEQVLGTSNWASSGPWLVGTRSTLDIDPGPLQ